MNELNELMLNFIDYVKNIKSRSKVWERYYFHIKNLIKFLIIERWNIKAEDIELTDILSFLNRYKVKKMQSWPTVWQYPTRNSLYNYIVSIRMFFKYLTMIWTKLKFNWEQIPIFKMEEARREPMSKEDYELLHNAPVFYNDLDRQDIIWRDQLIFEIPRETGLRIAELSRLKFEHFHNENRQFQIEVKWGRYESVFYSEKLRNKVLRYEEFVRKKYKFINIEHLFFCMWQKEKWKPMTSRLLGMTVTDCVKKLKKDWRLDKNKKLSLHMMRHSFAMRCVYSGLSQQATTALMRHKDPKITLHYYHLNNKRLLNQYDMIN